MVELELDDARPEARGLLVRGVRARVERRPRQGAPPRGSQRTEVLRWACPRSGDLPSG
ncbi:hypothetical protein ACFPRL_30590 [Pseudoclavibacter helvolus]